MHRSSFSLTLEDLPVLQQVGGVTFHPLGGNKLRCNQVPRITGISHKQAETLRSQAFALLHPKNNGQQKTTEAKVPAEPVILTAKMYNTFGDYICPNCKRTNYYSWKGDKKCGKCGKRVLVTPYSRD